jgi:hypothetical protein
MFLCPQSLSQACCLLTLCFIQVWSKLHNFLCTGDSVRFIFLRLRELVKKPDVIDVAFAALLNVAFAALLAVATLHLAHVCVNISFYPYVPTHILASLQVVYSSNVSILDSLAGISSSH